MTWSPRFRFSLRSTKAIVPSAALLLALLAAAAMGGASCGSDVNDNAAAGDGGSDDGGFNGGPLGDSTHPSIPTDDTNSKNYPCDGCAPFPAFGTAECDPGKLAKPGLVYPLDGLLLPPNMNVLEVQFNPPAGATLFEVDFFNAITKVKVETKCTPVPDVRGGAARGCGITLSQAEWNDIANINRDGASVGIAVRATTDGSCVATSQEAIAINFAKEDLAGGIYYWQSATYNGIAGTTGGIYQHDFGTFDPAPVPFYTSGSAGVCVGCHNLSRDGFRMSLGTDDPDADDEFGDVTTHLMDVSKKTVIGAKNTISPGFQTFTHDHAKGIATTFKQTKVGAGLLNDAGKPVPPPAGSPTSSGVDTSFAVFDGNSSAILALLPLPGMVGTQPDLSADDKSLVFVVPKSGTIPANIGDHHFEGGALWWATFDAAGNTLGAPVQLLADPSRNFYYPAISSNGTFVVFNDAPQPGNTATANNDAFYNRGARVKLVHFPGGGAPLDMPTLNAGDGLSNSWPRWSPFVQTYKGHKLLWVTFSSNRDYGLHLVNKGFDNCYPPEGPDYDQPQPLSKKGVTYANCAQPQIWMAGIIIDEDASFDAKDRSYPAFWLPFQDVNSHNHSAQWVEKVQSPGSGGAPPDAGGGNPPGCVGLGATCGGSATCCSDTVCCGGLCEPDCVN